MSWSELASSFGRKCVVTIDPNVSDEDVDECTTKQIGAVYTAVYPLLRGDEYRALDFGCGAGRFTHMLAGWVSYVHAYDTCPELMALADRDLALPQIIWRTFLPTLDFDIVFAAMLLGDPNVKPGETAATMAQLLAPDGLLVMLEHTAETQPEGRWWQFRPESFYIDLFKRHDIALERHGTCDQLGNEVTILAGRRT